MLLSWKNLALSFFAALLVGALWLSLPQKARPGVAPFSLPSHISDINLTATLSYYETQLEGETVAFTRTLRGVARLHPSPSPASTRYRVEWRTVEWVDDEGTPLLVFEKNEDGVSYRSAPSLSHHEREKLFALFHVDLTHHDANNDRSLFQLPLSFSLSQSGDLQEVSLPAPLRRVLQTSIRGLQGYQPLQELVDNRSDATHWTWKEAGPSHLDARFFHEQERNLLGQPEGYQLTLSLQVEEKLG